MRQKNNLGDEEAKEDDGYILKTDFLPSDDLYCPGVEGHGDK